MPPSALSSSDILVHNRRAWDLQAERQCEWSRPVDEAAIAAARAGRLAPRLTAGAEVTVFDLSERQLDLDRMVAARERLALTAVRGDMRDLSCFSDASFDLVFHPISNLYVPEIGPVWRECFRVLASGGQLLASFYNPVVFVGDRDPDYAARGLIRPCHGLPYAEIDQLGPDAIAAKQEKGEALVYGHSLAEQIAGQLAAGFVLTGFQEDMAPAPRFVIDSYLPTFIATRARKP